MDQEKIVLLIVYYIYTWTYNGSIKYQKYKVTLKNNKSKSMQ